MKVLAYPDLGGGAAAALPREGKFLQIRWCEQDFAIFADWNLHRYHNQILAHFLADQGISHRWVGADRLEVVHPDLRAIGGGRFRLDLEERHLHVWDNSLAYGRFAEAGLRNGLAGAGCPWNRMRLTID